MRVSEILGQLLMIASGEEPSTGATEGLVRQLRPGGILLSSRQMQTPDSTAGFLRRLWLALPTPPLLALEEEGGSLDPLRVLFPPLPSPQAASQKGDAVARRLGELIGEGMRLVGFNANLAPLLQLAVPGSKNDPGARAFSSDPHQVAGGGEAFVQGLLGSRMLPCAKYFPGGADPRGSEEPAVIGKPMAGLWREDLIPYRALLPQLPMVVVGHGAYKSFDYELPCPASLSQNVVEGLLRVKLGYDGVAIAGNLDAMAIRRTADLGEAAVRAVTAGCDLLLIGGGEESAQQALAGLERGFALGRLPARRVEQALARLDRARKGLAIPSGRVPVRAFARLARQFEDFSAACRPVEQKIA